MTQQLLGLGSQPGDGTGTPGRTGGGYINNNFSELYQNAFFFGADTGSVNACVIASCLPQPASYTLNAGAIVHFSPAFQNTGPATLAFLSAGIKPIVNPAGVPLSGGELATTNITTLQYTGAAWQILYINNAVLLDQLIGPIAVSYPQSTAEASVSVTPVSLAYYYGDLRRYGANPGSDVTAALVAACTQAQAAAGAPVYISSALGAACTLSGTSPVVTIVTPITVYGDGRESSQLSTSLDLTIFSLTTQGASAGSTFRDFQLQGAGRANVISNFAFVVNGSPYNSWMRMRVQNFGGGIQFNTGTYSSYLNCIINSEIDVNRNYNIYAQSQTHQLTMHGVTFGACLLNSALYLTDSSGLSIVGGDCEGNLGACSIDIDNAAGTSNGGHTICGVDFEASNLSVAEIRIGNSHKVGGVSIFGCPFANGGSTPYVVDSVNSAGVTVFSCNIGSGYSSGIFSLSANTFNFQSFANSGTLGGPFGANYQFQSSVIGSQIPLTESGGTGSAINCQLGNDFVITCADATSFPMSAPANASTGQRITITIRNTNASSTLATTWNAIYKIAAWPVLAAGFSRSIDLTYNGTNWVEQTRAPTDVPN